MTLTIDEFYIRNKAEDLCFSISDGRISDSIEDWFEEYKECVTDVQSLNDITDSAKHIRVYKKERYFIPHGSILEYITEYLENKYGYDACEMGYLEDMMDVSDIKLLAEIETRINNRIRNYYTSDCFIDEMDVSEEFNRWLGDELGEDYPNE